ncbi:MAG TPA: glycosyltransferase, partial [Candidatus Cloacimonadota bacterium]|nr:glycosyltransferase [Candidatus Cloacimonadota bacterium]
DAAIAATPHIAQSFLPRAVPVVHNYPILSEWSQASDDSARYASRQLCYIGSITRERGLTQLIKAIESVDCTLHLAGSYEPGEYRDELTAQPGWQKVIEYGYVNREAANSIFNQCALGVVLFDHSPNHLYSLSTKMFEYMAAGLPILVSDLPANVQLLSDSRCGVFVNPSDIQEISAKLSAMLETPSDLEAMGKRGQELVRTRLNWDSELSTYLDIYRKILS